VTDDHDQDTRRNVLVRSTEDALAGLWRHLLHVPVTGPDADFFALGGDSFQAVQLATLVTERFNVHASPDLAFEMPAIGAQARWIAGQVPRAAAPPDRAPAVPSLSTQQEDFLVWMAEPEVPRDIGSIAVAIRITDVFDPALFAEALAAVVRRHEALRTVCRMGESGRYSVSIAADRPPDVAEVRTSGNTLADREADALRLAAAERLRLADLTADPLVRALVIRLGPEDHVLVLSVHHFVFDGWSMGLVLREVGLEYSALRTGRPSPLAPLEMTYSQYCSWSRTQWALNQPYWDGVLDGAPRALEPFPGRRSTDRFSWRVDPLEIDAGVAGQLRAAARAHGATAFMGVTTCWSAVLAEWTGLDDLMLMSPAPGRTAPEHNGIVGCLVQSLLLRIDASGAPSYDELLRRVRATVLGANAHQLHAYQDARLRVPYPSRIHYESWSEPPNFPGLLSEPCPLPRFQDNLVWHAPTGERDLSSPWLVIEERPDGSLYAGVVYNVHSFDAAVVRSLAESFRRHVDTFTTTLTAE
jgi:acyl carrier protein